MAVFLLTSCHQEGNMSQQGGNDHQEADGSYADISHNMNDISIVGAGQSGIYDIFCRQLSSMFPEGSAFSLSSLISNGSIDNIEYLSQQQLDFGIVQSDLAQAAFQGKGHYQDNARGNLRVVTALFDEYLIVLTNKRDLVNIGDLKGKRISVGALNSGNLAIAEQLLSTIGFDENICTFAYESIGDAIHSLISKNVDAVIVVAGRPVPLLLDGEHSQEIFSLVLSQEEINKLLEINPALERAVLPENTYPFLKSPYQTIKTRAFLMAHEKTESSKIHAMLSALYDRGETSASLGKSIEMYPADEVNKYITIPLHDAARVYFDQRSSRALVDQSAADMIN